MTDYPINQGLLEESLKLKEERNLVQKRLEKIEASREEVSANVYKRVHNDYQNRLTQLDDRLLDKKQDIDRELAGLFETRDKIQSNLKNHKDNLEELQFRHNLGEYDQATFDEKSKTEEEKVTRFEQVLSGVQNNIEKYEGLFEEADFGESEISEVSAKVSPLTSEEIDAWEEEAKVAQATLDVEPEEPSPLDEEEKWLDETKPEIETEEKSKAAQLTIISGAENVGKSFSLNGSAITIGRSHNNLVILKDVKVSRQHAEVKLHGDDYIILDLNSSNGTKVNGDKIREQILQTNDEIQIGGFVLQFQK